MGTYNKRTRFFEAYLLLSVLISFATAGTAYCQNIYDSPFRDNNGKNVNLKDFTGKKILFIILSISDSDSLADQLKNFTANYGDKVQVIGVLSQEDGFTPDKRSLVKAAYQNTGILFTDVMGSRKGSGQSPLMKWLTGKKENGHFDIDIKGPGQKFFVDGEGKLYAVLAPEVSLSSSFITRVVNAASNVGQAVPPKEKTKQ